MPTIKLNPYLKDFWKAEARNKVLYGGRSSSKSYDACSVLMLMSSFKKLRIMCTRRYQNKITDSVYTLIKDRIGQANMENEFDILKTTIRHKITDSEFIFYGIERNVDEIKSTEGVDILYIEEAQSLTEEQWKILYPTIRKEGAQIFIVFNPRLATDFVYKRFILNPPPDTVSQKINYIDNPFLSKTMLKLIQDAKDEDEESYNHIYLGHPKINDDDAIIKRSWIEASIDAHVKLNIEITGAYKIGFDIADSGDDKCAIAKIHGILTYEIKEWKASEDELNESSLKAYNQAKENNSIINYDCIGVGASAGSHFRNFNKERGNSMKYNKFNASSKVKNPERYYDVASKIKNKDFFSNLKAQSWWNLAERFKNTYNAINKGMEFKEEDLISISSECDKLEQLIEELSTPRKAFDKTGKVKVESKDELKARGIPSPNIADSVIMAYSNTSSGGFFS